MAEQQPAGTGPANARAGSVTVLVRYFAAARAAAGTLEEHLTLPASSGEVPHRAAETPPESGSRVITVAAVLAGASDRHGPELERVLRRCSFLLDETAVHGTETEVLDGQVLDILPPFAGG